MDKIRLIIEISRFFERELEKNGATGKGLHEKVNSIEPLLPNSVVKQLRRIASIRNKELHSDGADFDEGLLLRDALNIALNWNQGLKHEKMLFQQKNEEVKLKKAKEALEKELIKVEMDSIELEKSTKALLDNEVEELLLIKCPRLIDDELEDLIDDANSLALAVYYPSYERWDSFIYLAKSKSRDDTERLKNLVLSVYAGGDICTTIKLVRKLISKAFLRKEYDNCCNNNITNKDRLCERSEPQSYPVVGRARD